MRKSAIACSILLALDSLLAFGKVDCDAPFASGFSYAALKQAAAQCKSLDTKEGLIASLPEELRKNFALLYCSESPQGDGVDPLHPRVVLTSADGSILIAFTGDASKQAYKSVEVIELNARSEFVSHEISFGKSRSDFHDHPRTDCARCHGTKSFHPIWNPYLVWPCAYGSVHDTLSSVFELNHFKEFLATNGSQGVYRSLIGLGTPGGPFLDGREPNVLTGVAISQSNAKRQARILSDAKGFRNARPFRYAILAGLIGCDHIESFVPESMRARFARSPEEVRKQVFKAAVDEFRDRVKKVDEHTGSTSFVREDGSASLLSGELESSAVDMTGTLPWTAKLMYLLQNEPVDFSDWGLTKQKDTHVFTSGTEKDIQLVLSSYEKNVRPLEAEIRNEVEAFLKSAMDDKNNYGYGNANLSAARNSVCSKLLPLSLNALKGLSAAQEPKACKADGSPVAGPVVDGMEQALRAVSIPDIVTKTCMGCHSDGNSKIRRINFADPRSLSKDDREKILSFIGPDSPHQMPPDRKLSEQEQRDIRDYLSNTAPWY